MKTPICNLALLVVCLVQSAKAACNVASVTTASGTAYNPPSMLCPGDLIFEDNFNTFDESKWMHEVTMAGGGNGKFEYYRNSRTNSFAQDGNLHIKPSYLSEDYSEDFLYSGTLDITAECTNSDNNGCLRTGTSTNILNPIESARIRTLGTFSFKYGTVIARAKLPGGDWLWPAIWLLPTDWKYGSWPVSGEIDLVESRGNRDLTDVLFIGDPHLLRTNTPEHTGKEATALDTTTTSIPTNNHGYFPDGTNNAGGKPWSNDSPTPMTDFWQGKTQWEPTWNRNTDESHLIVDYIQVFAA
ncbi:hypothetical protein HUJ04_010124 [Dendroctonus ponderosae]|nr:hypothetical protein HUJ04_010124 [Dendroctonus ponderosae]